MMSLLVTSSIAKSDEVILLNKDQTAPYTGFLFPREKALEFRKIDIENDELKIVNASFSRSIDIFKKNEDLSEKKVNILLERNDVLAKDLTDARTLTDWQKIGYFVGGVVLTGVSVWGASQLRK